MNKGYESPYVCYGITSVIAGLRYSFVTGLLQFYVTKFCTEILSVHTLRM